MDTLGWGFILWLVGYALGIMLFTIVPLNLIGWIITPIGIAITVWVLLKKIKSEDFLYYLKLSVVWTIIAIIFDYFFLVKSFKPAYCYYKLYLYLYYSFVFLFSFLLRYYNIKFKF